MMKALEIDGQFGLDHLKLPERPKPEPRFGEVMVRTRAVSFNCRDTQMVAGNIRLANLDLRRDSGCA
jgi:NADPH:quinone reductase-like Zn-dependent oxidoreductase